MSINEDLEKAIRDQKRQREIADATRQLEDAINVMTVKIEMIATEFRKVHPHLLNKIGLGVMKAIHSHRADGRIAPTLAEASELIWGKT